MLSSRVPTSLHIVSSTARQCIWLGLRPLYSRGGAQTICVSQTVKDGRFLFRAQALFTCNLRTSRSLIARGAAAWPSGSAKIEKDGASLTTFGSCSLSRLRIVGTLQATCTNNEAITHRICAEHRAP
eukprot:5042297-Pleurochrysis_carterae.AAC.1